jgi:hypothetical protein
MPRSRSEVRPAASSRPIWFAAAAAWPVRAGAGEVECGQPRVAFDEATQLGVGGLVAVLGGLLRDLPGQWLRAGSEGGGDAAWRLAASARA